MKHLRPLSEQPLNKARTARTLYREAMFYDMLELCGEELNGRAFRRTAVLERLSTVFGLEPPLSMRDYLRLLREDDGRVPGIATGVAITQCLVHLDEAVRLARRNPDDTYMVYYWREAHQWDVKHEQEELRGGEFILARATGRALIVV